MFCDIVKSSMNSKVNNVDYDLIASRFISDHKLSLTIQQNISFVEKYIDIVDNVFKNDIEKHIVYRELGSIVYSAIEAVLKSVLFEINKRCDKRNCNNAKCKYRKYDTIYKINNERSINVLMHLLNARLFGLSQEQINEIKNLNDLRNYVHISKSIDGSDKSTLFDKEYVIRMLSYYYEILNQLDLDEFYFKDGKACLRMLDDNGFDYTEQQMQNERKSFYLSKIFFIVNKLFSNEQLSENDKWVLKMLNDDRNIDIETMATYITKEITFSNRRFKTKRELNNHKNKVLNILFSFIVNEGTKSAIIDKINKNGFL